MDNKKKMKAMIKQMQSVIALVIIFVVASTICIKDGRNNFLDIRNLMNVLRAVSENGIIAIGMTIILILGDRSYLNRMCISDGKEWSGICTGHPCKPWNRSIVWTV